MRSEIVNGCQSDLDDRYGAGAWTVVDYASEFEALWSGTYENGIILFWDGMPAGLNAAPVDIESSLTPYDWVLSFSREMAGRSIATDLRVVIYDITFGDMSDAFGVRMSSVLAANFPWISICRRLEDLQACIEHRSLCPITLNDKSIVDLFAQIWINNLARDESHHDINNLLGPMLLLDAMGRGSSDHLGRATMMLHVRRLGLIDSVQANVDIEKLLAEPREVVSALESRLRFVLIDDQADQGWAHVIAGMSNLEPQTPARTSDTDKLRRWSKPGKTELWTCTSAKPLVDRLCQGLGIDSENGDAPHPTDLRFSLAFTEAEAEANVPDDHRWQEILLLDLRLGRDGGIERTVLRLVVQIALEIDRRLASVTDRLSLIPGESEWPHLEWTDEQWSAWLDTACSPGSSLHAMALGMLGSVIAAVDMAYPIVIFSSTGQREIVESFRGSPTILTDFEKPRILGSGASDWFFCAAMQWRDAIVQAADILHVRLSVQRVMRATLAAKAELAADSFRHVTIALDETGDFDRDGCSAIGGVVIETKGKTLLEAKIETVNFLEHLRQNGVNFYDHVPAYTELGRIGTFVAEKPLRKGHVIADKLGSALRKFQNCKLGSFRCFIDDSEYTNECFLGETYLKWLVVTLEVLLAEYLPSQGWQNSRTGLSIWLPQRTVGGEVTEAQRLDFNQHDGRITTLGGRSVAYALVARALEDRVCFEEVISSIASLKIRKIPYYANYDGHYESATDWYCVDCKAFSGVTKSSFQRIHRNGNEIPYGSGNHRHCNFHLNQYLAADFSVAAHLADAAISKTSLPGRQLGKANIRNDLSFDVDASQRLVDFLQVGRLFDRGFPNDAFRLAFRNDFFVSGLNRKESDAAGAKIERRLVSRLAGHVSRIDAAMVVDLALLPRTRFRK